MDYEQLLLRQALQVTHSSELNVPSASRGTAKCRICETGNLVEFFRAHVQKGYCILNEAKDDVLFTFLEHVNVAQINQVAV